MIKDTQIPERYRAVISEQVDIYKQGRAITQKNSIPDTTDIPIENPKHWLRIPDVICVYVDMLGSTRLSAEKHDQSTAGAYQLFTGTAVRLFSEFESPYIDVRGDGVFALFDQNQPYRAFSAATTFKTFSKEEFVPRIKENTGVEIGCHIGIDMKTVLVRKVGFKRWRGRSDRQNEVWAGKPVNMAAKLASLTEDGQLLVSDRYLNKITDDLVRWSCGCPNGTKVYLWERSDLTSNTNFDFDSGQMLKSQWCEIHGSEVCEKVMALDED